MTPRDIFVGRLRRHRERNRISIEYIANETRVKPALIEGFERSDLTGWPRGLYARAWVRAYASVVGLDPIDTVDEFCRLFPEGDRRVQPTIQEIAAIIASPSEYRDEFAHDVDRRGHSPHINMLRKPRPVDALVGALMRSVRTAAAWVRPVAKARPQGVQRSLR